ncbi:hypothetical protein ABPG74_009616 [Tetrahymena malaccensis]
MSLFRSEDMEYCRIVLPRESAWETLNELGKNDCIHQIDTDSHLPNIARPFHNQIKRCDEIEFMLNEIKQYINKYEGFIIKCKNVKDLVDVVFTKVLDSRQRAGKTYFEEIENDVIQRYNNLKDQVQNLDNISEKQKQLEEYKQVLNNAQQILGDAFFMDQQQSFSDDRIDIHGKGLEELRTDFNLNKISGIIDTSDTIRFQKVIFRITKGNCFIAFKEAEELTTLNSQSRSVFVLMFPGNRNGLVYQKASRICESFNANRFQCPSNQAEFNQKKAEIDRQIIEGKQIINLTKKNLLSYLEAFTLVKHDANCSYIEYLNCYVAKEKSIYQAMNCLRISGSVLVGFCWVPTEKIPDAQQALGQLANKFSNLPSSTLKVISAGDQKPPTYFKLNDFKAVFQTIVDTYGVPRYKEVNPGLFTIVTFPFLFGVMFGDIGHGGLLFIFGLYLLFFKDSILSDKYSSIKALIPARYLIVLMGMFALFCGFIYNDFLSLRLDLFGSCFEVKTRTNVDTKKDEEYVIPKSKDCTYPFGIDPMWGKTSNELTFVNSFKMKLAVIFAILQMCLGISMKAFNSVYFRKWVDFFFEFVPQILFMGLMFGYMDYLIFAKWSIDYTDADYNLAKDAKIPSIITTLIDMALTLGSVKSENGSIISNQSSIQTAILAISLICVPMMLFPKPIILHLQNKRKQRLSHIADDHSQQHLLHGQDEDDLARDLEKAQLKLLSSGIDAQKQGGDGHGEHEGFGEIFVHQIIETIEFVLGSISNTASYLRLWALSLAHSQLAAVFFDKALKSGVENGSIPMLVIGYLVFAKVTLGVLMAMDVMECFLHALRLHWVEFQNKFYKADGYAFTPFSFVNAIKTTVPSEEEEEEAAKKQKTQ